MARRRTTLKKALLVGINAYAGSPLRGCLNDVDRMRELLAGRFGFPAENLRVLRDAEATAQAIKRGLHWLADGDDAGGAVRVFHFSGHGKHVPDDNGDEPDGRDEAIVPYDYETEGFITDDALARLYERFPRGSNLTIVMDCCHSGTNTRDVAHDVRYRFLPSSYEDYLAFDAAQEKYEGERLAYLSQQLDALRGLPQAEYQRRKENALRRFQRLRARFGDARRREDTVLMAAARSDQIAADAIISGGFHGAFTWYLTETIAQAGETLTYGEAVKAVAGKLQKAGYRQQVPQLECRARNRDHPIFTPFDDSSGPARPPKPES